MGEVFLVDVVLLLLAVAVGIATIRSRSLLASTMLLAVPSLALLFTSPLAARAREPALTLWRRGPARS